MADQLDVLVFGIGAIGSFYAFILNRSDNVRLTVVARSNYDAVRMNGLTINSEIHGSHTFRPHSIIKTPAEAHGTFDYVVCTHKAIDQSTVAVQLEPVITAKTNIVIIQNGVGNEEPFRKAFPQNNIISCVTWVCSLQTSPGIVKHIKSENTQIGLFPKAEVAREVEKAHLNKFTALLKNGNTPFDVEADIQVKRWEKVVWNVAWNSVTALTLLDTHSWLNSSGGMSLTRQLMAEVIEVARKCDSPLSYDLVDEFLDRILKLPPIHSSMYADRVAGRPMEVEMILGTPVRKAKEFGLKAPITTTFYTLLTAMNENTKQPSG